MTSFGKINVFNPEVEEFSAYLERIELYFVANGISEEKQVPVFLSLLEAKTYSLLRTLVAPTPPKKKPLKDLTKLLKSHFEPTPLVIAERFAFHRHNQQSGETVGEYLAELRKLATHCKFVNNLDEVLRDRLVCGLKSENIQKSLLAEDNLDLKRALEMAQGMEAANRNAQMLRENNPSASVMSDDNISNSVAQMEEEIDRVGRFSRPQGTSGSGKKCYRCGRSDHFAHNCVHKDTVCHNCKKCGHLARRVCHARGSQPPGREPQLHNERNGLSKDLKLMIQKKM